jgi:hypothetical protein
MIIINSPHTLKLVEKCLLMKEDRLARSGNIEPWGYCIMCNTVGLLDVHLGNKNVEEAQAWAHQRFARLHGQQQSLPGPASSVVHSQASQVSNIMASGPAWPRVSGPLDVRKPPMDFLDPSMQPTFQMSMMPGNQLVRTGPNDFLTNLGMEYSDLFGGQDLDQIWNDNWLLG